MTSIFIRNALGAVTICLVPMADSLAQTDDIEELVITGTRVPVSAQNLGASFSILDKRAIGARQVPVVTDLLRDLPGLSVSPTGPLGSQTQIRIRGAEGNHTLVLIDGVEATDPVGNFELDFADLLTTGIERIEVIRGPQSALYGSEAIGGVINILTRDPQDGFDAEAFGEGGAFGTARLGATVSAGRDRFGGVFSAGYLDTKGISASPSGDEKDGYRNLTLSGKLRARATAALELGITGRFVSAQSEFDRQDFFSGDIVDADLQRDFEAFYGRAYAVSSHFDGDWQQKAALELTKTDSDSFSDGTFTNSAEGERLKASYQSTLQFYGQSLSAAIEHEELRFRARDQDPQALSNQRAKDDQTSIIGEWQAGPFDRAHLALGVRHDFNDIFRDETTWRLAASFDLSATVQLHGSYGTGVADPTFFDRFGFFPDQFQGNPDLSPEKARGFDAGVRKSLFDDSLSVDVTWFSTELRDEIVPVFDPVTFLSTVENQPGKSDREGIELAAHYDLGSALALDAAYTWLDATEPDRTREVRRARHQASFTATWRPDVRSEFSLDFDYNGAQDDLDFSSFPASRVRLDGYLLVTLAARYTLVDGVDLFGRIENALDETYQSVLGFNTPGIGAYAGLRARF